MILNQNIVIDGQTYFSGERIVPVTEETWIYTKKMNWLHEHQTAVRIAAESMFLTSPTYGAGSPELVLGDIGVFNDITTPSQNIPVVV